ncbi:MAG TPA: hypothetical protein P5270_08280, partial [Victivallales bacterium]|nr:hypothetical protein [Victivallales bacterium]
MHLFAEKRFGVVTTLASFSASLHYSGKTQNIGSYFHLSTSIFWIDFGDSIKKSVRKIRKRIYIYYSKNNRITAKMNLKISNSTLNGEISVPGSKSHTIRAVAIASMAEGYSTIVNP